MDCELLGKRQSTRVEVNQEPLTVLCPFLLPSNQVLQKQVSPSANQLPRISRFQKGGCKRKVLFSLGIPAKLLRQHSFPSQSSNQSHRQSRPQAFRRLLSFAPLQVTEGDPSQAASKGKGGKGAKGKGGKGGRGRFNPYWRPKGQGEGKKEQEPEPRTSNEQRQSAPPLTEPMEVEVKTEAPEYILEENQDAKIRGACIKCGAPTISMPLEQYEEYVKLRGKMSGQPPTTPDRTSSSPSQPSPGQPRTPPEQKSLGHLRADLFDQTP